MDKETILQMKRRGRTGILRFRCHIGRACQCRRLIPMSSRCPPASRPGALCLPPSLPPRPRGKFGLLRSWGGNCRGLGRPPSPGRKRPIGGRVGLCCPLKPRLPHSALQGGTEGGREGLPHRREGRAASSSGSQSEAWLASVQMRPPAFKGRGWGGGFHVGHTTSTSTPLR